jgi:hypothetical protein
MFGSKHTMSAFDYIRERQFAKAMGFLLIYLQKIRVLTPFNIAIQRGRKKNLRRNFMPGH